MHHRETALTPDQWSRVTALLDLRPRPGQVRPPLPMWSHRPGEQYNHWAFADCDAVLRRLRAHPAALITL